MKNRNMIITAAMAASLLFSGLTFADSDLRGPEDVEKATPAQHHAVAEQVTTNVLLQQILAELIKANALKTTHQCSDGEKRYSPGYVIRVGKKTLRCDDGEGFPEWVAEDGV